MMKSYATRILSLILALVLSFSLCISALAAGGFSDVPTNYWAYDDIMACAEQGIVAGYEDGTFQPGKEVTTVQFLVMLTRTFYADELNQVVTPAGQPWYYANVKVANDVGMTQGLSAVDDKPMSRYDMAAALKSIIAVNRKSPMDDKLREARLAIKDYEAVPYEYRIDVTLCYATGVLTGMSDGTFSGEQSMTRAQACTVIVRIMNLINGAVPVTPTTPTTPTQPQQPEQPEQTGTAKLANGKDITSENVLEILAEIQEEYPTGTIWGQQGTANNNYYAAGNTSTDVRACVRQFKTDNGLLVGTEYGCGGWAAMVSDRIFGKTGFPAREVTDRSKVRAGDIIISFNSKGQLVHVGIASSDAYAINNTYAFHACEGNFESTVHWGTGNYYIKDTIRCFTRYPD